MVLRHNESLMNSKEVFFFFFSNLLSVQRNICKTHTQHVMCDQWKFGANIAVTCNIVILTAVERTV